MLGQRFHPAWLDMRREYTGAWPLASHLAQPLRVLGRLDSALICQWALQTCPPRGNVSSLLHPLPPCSPGDILLMTPTHPPFLLP